MRSRTALRVLAGIGILVLSATVAQAGGGGSSPTPLASFYVCQGISKDTASGQVVDVDFSFFGANLQSVTIGSGVLACAAARLFPGGTVHSPCPAPQGTTCNEINPNPNPLPGLDEQLKCYSFSGTRSAGSPPSTVWNVTDQLFAGVDFGVQVNQLHFICAPATFAFPQ